MKKKFDRNLFKNVTLLYVEDDLMTLEEISFFLKKYVKTLLIAKNGKEGLELFKEHNPDMVITDIQMPIMNGLEMSEKIFEINPNIPIAITTAFSDGNYIMRAIELGIDKYIIKPINMQELLAVIQKSLNLSFLSKDYHYEEYIQFILDSNPTFMFIMHLNNVEYANKSFLELLGHDNVITLKENINSCDNLFEIHGQDEETKWINYIMENKEERHLVSLKNNKCKRYIKTEFYVTYRHFNETNKSVFVFVDAKEDKLNQINKITTSLLLNNELDQNIIKSLNEIKYITKSSQL